MSLHSIISSLKHTDTAVKPRQKSDSTDFSELYSVFESQTAPNNATALQEAAPPLHVPSRRPRASWRIQMLPHSAVLWPTLPSRLGVKRATACRQRHTEVSRRHGSNMTYLIDTTQGYSVSARRLHPRVRDVTLSRLRKQQLHYKGGVIWLQTLHHTVSQRHIYTDMMTTTSLSLKWHFTLFIFLTVHVILYIFTIWL